MICKPCADGADYLAAHKGEQLPIATATLLHNVCKGPTRCDCQHKVDLQAQGKAVQR